MRITGSPVPFRLPPPPAPQRRRNAGPAPAPVKRHNDRVELEQGCLGGLHPKEARHSQGGGVPFLDLDEAAVAVSGLTKTGAMLINALASFVALLGAYSAARELQEASEELPELEAQRESLAARPPAAPGADSPARVHAAARNHGAAQRRVVVAQRTAVAKAALGVPSCIGALTMGLSVLLGPDLLGAVLSTATASAVLMHIAVPSIAVFGLGTALLQAIQAVRQGRALAALKALDAPGTRPEDRAMARQAADAQRGLRRWRVAATVAGSALALGVLLAFWVGPVGLALLLPGALALPVCNAVIAKLSQFDAPCRADHVPEADENSAPTYADAADAHTYAGPSRDLISAHAAARAEQAICKDVPLRLYTGTRLRRALGRFTTPRALRDRPAERAFGDTYARILEARLGTTRGSDGEEAVAQAVRENQRLLRALDVDAAPKHTLDVLLRSLIAEDAVAPLLAGLHGVPALAPHLPKPEDGALTLGTQHLRRALHKLPKRERAACIRAVSERAVRALVHTVQADAQARERQAMSQFVAVAEFS